MFIIRRRHMLSRIISSLQDACWDKRWFKYLTLLLVFLAWVTRFTEIIFFIKINMCSVDWALIRNSWLEHVILNFGIYLSALNSFCNIRIGRVLISTPRQWPVFERLIWWVWPNMTWVHLKRLVKVLFVKKK